MPFLYVHTGSLVFIIFIHGQRGDDAAVQKALKPDSLNNCQSRTSGARMLITPENTANWL